MPVVLIPSSSSYVSILKVWRRGHRWLSLLLSLERTEWFIQTFCTDRNQHGLKKLLRTRVAFVGVTNHEQRLPSIASSFDSGTSKTLSRGKWRGSKSSDSRSWSKKAIKRCFKVFEAGSKIFLAVQKFVGSWFAKEMRLSSKPLGDESKVVSGKFPHNICKPRFELILRLMRVTEEGPPGALSSIKFGNLRMGSRGSRFGSQRVVRREKCWRTLLNPRASSWSDGFPLKPSL